MREVEMGNNKRNRIHKLSYKPSVKNTPITPDEAVLNLIYRSNADLSKQRLVNFYLYFPTKENAEVAAIELIDLEFTIDCIDSSKKNEWLCLATKEIVPNYKNLTTIRKILERIVRKLNGVYDGWETGFDADEVSGLPNVE
jgi:hypothetical protein